MAVATHAIRLDGNPGGDSGGAPSAFPCRGDETVVAAMERLRLPAPGLRRTPGRPIPVGCRQGGCGVCRVQILSGSYRLQPMSRAHVSEAEERAGYALACRLIPESDLDLRCARRTGAAATGAPVPAQPITNT
ncbi:ferredoxin [Azospirillum agricola]|uniref:2Fe-2S iron-sulfur cluster binding domain-containing protein n=1 Tax=Azospirillum agricola TaxID=1720247 RepID=UPI001AE63359|nr:2Fe-2S iron-sulfur cluster binding domain-containing protein [Azospirillum agricola]MBP2227919.1 ferredoxin [Azospirillum agricola]